MLGCDVCDRLPSSKHSRTADSGAGLTAQRAAIVSEAARRGWTDVRWIEDAGHSAKSLDRPGLTDALARLRDGRASVLCAAKMDRVSRSLLDYAALMQAAQREGWALLALDSPADLTTPHGEAMAGVQAVFAQLERRLISERTKAALAQRRAAGVRLGRPPTIPDEVAALARELRAAGLTLQAVGAALERAGYPAPSGNRWHPSTVSRLIARTIA